MAKKLSSTEWIENAIKIWGDTYDYSESKYINSKEKLVVICRKHGRWNVMPVNHVSGRRGCPKCAQENIKIKLIKPFEYFLKEASKIHSGKYSYEKSNYQGAKIKIKISCPEHGIFLQSPEVHLRPSQCPSCAKDVRKSYDRYGSLKNIIEKINSRSGGNVNINEKTFVNINSHAEFICTQHGNYRRLVNSTIHSKHPCIKCAKDISKNKSINFKIIENKIFEKFDKVYDYQIKFGGNLRKTSLIFTCKMHGTFELMYSSLNRSAGCPVCSRLKSQPARNAGLNLKNIDERINRSNLWIQRAIKIHGNKFDYKNVTYINAKTPVIIACPIHGDFKQIPDTHLKSGCRLCADDQLLGKYSDKYFIDNPERMNVEATLYYIKFVFKNEIFYKVGITTTSINIRFSMVKSLGVRFEPLNLRKYPLIDAFKAEQAIQRLYGDKFRYKPNVDGKSLRKMRIGPSECFKKELPIEIINKFFASE